MGSMAHGSGGDHSLGQFAMNLRLGDDGGGNYLRLPMPLLHREYSSWLSLTTRSNASFAFLMRY